MGANLNRHLSQENIQIANKYMKGCSTSLAIRKVQNKTTIRYHLIPVGMAINHNTSNNNYWRNSSQDGSIGRNALLPHTTKRRITSNLKTKNNHNCQEIICMEIQQPRGKETFIRTGKRGRDGQPRVERPQQGGGGGLRRRSHICAQIS